MIIHDHGPSLCFVYMTDLIGRFLSQVVAYPSGGDVKY